MSNFTIKIEAPEIVKAITILAQALNGGSSKMAVIELSETVEKEPKTVEKETKVVEKKEEPKKVEKKEEPKKEEVETKFTEVEVRAKFVELNKKGKKAELKEMLDSFKVIKVSDLKPEQYAEVMQQLGEM